MSLCSKEFYIKSESSCCLQNRLSKGISCASECDRDSSASILVERCLTFSNRKSIFWGLLVCSAEILALNLVFHYELSHGGRFISLRFPSWQGALLFHTKNRTRNFYRCGILMVGKRTSVPHTISTAFNAIMIHFFQPFRSGCYPCRWKDYLMNNEENNRVLLGTH